MTRMISIIVILKMLLARLAEYSLYRFSCSRSYFWYSLIESSELSIFLIRFVRMSKAPLLTALPYYSASLAATWKLPSSLEFLLVFCCFLFWSIFTCRQRWIKLGVLCNLTRLDCFDLLLWNSAENLMSVLIFFFDLLPVSPKASQASS